MTSAFHTILDTFRKNANSEHDKGSRFEHLIQRYLTTDPVYSQRFSEVWLWMDWPLRGGLADQGIDLVAREAVSGEYCAIQCKCYADNTVLGLSDVATFTTSINKTWAEGASFATGIIVDTSRDWNSKLQKLVREFNIPIARLGVVELANSPIDWESLAQGPQGEMKLLDRYQPRPHQQEAIEKVITHFQTEERGKLIMACGTGKTFTALRLSERYSQAQGCMLFLVPSIALLSQSLREWLTQAEIPIHAIAVCSDAAASAVPEVEDLLVNNLPMPACTDVDSVGAQYAVHRQKGGLSVIFSTYQSIDVIHKAQEQGKLPQFNLTICDEAHRTTGVSLKKKDAAGYDHSAFTRIHDKDFIRSDKRLYMTATPKIYTVESRKKAEDNDALLASMDDILFYGEEIHRLPFSRAVRENLLTDYKVLVLCVDEAYVKETFHRELQEAEGGMKLHLNDAVKLLGCYNGLRKKLIRITSGDGEDSVPDLLKEDPEPMRRAVAFCGRIAESKSMCEQMRYIAKEMVQREEASSQALSCEIDHVDGTMGANKRNELLDWLKQDMGESHCRILSNARCLSEGVDVPALDAVMFLAPRRSKVDIVQAVGRVMRRAAGKKYGYIILPVGVPEGKTPEEVLESDAAYDVVWDVLQALRAHDDRFNAEINKIELNKKGSSMIEVLSPSPAPKQTPSPQPEPNPEPEPEAAPLFTFNVEEWREAILARVVKKCGTRRYWESWAKDIADIAERQILHIDELIQDPTCELAFGSFVSSLRRNINPAISREEAVEMLAQQAITRPVFEALFEGYDFVSENPISHAMNEMLALLDERTSSDDQHKLQLFYESVRERAAGIDNQEGKQKVIVELYDKFFKNAFPKMADKLGIVYTPVEVVDFMIKSVHSLLKNEFGFKKGIGERNVRILDPFTGTGTFMVRLIQSGLMDKRTLAYKYAHEFYASEIVLLAYYIACVNIEEAFHSTAGLDYYAPFEGICLTDTFLMGEKGDFLADMFSDNAERVKNLCSKDVRVIIANPPYSVGQTSANDNNQNESYAALDQRIADTYAAKAKTTNKNSLYDSYMRAFRWASDRIGEEGIVAFVSNGSFVDSNTMSGFRQSLMEEFTSIHCFNLRGNALGSGVQRKKEAGNVFKVGTRTTVAITILVKRKEHQGQATLHYHDIGDYLSAAQKLQQIKDFSDMNAIPWQTLQPDEHGDWLNLRSGDFAKFIPLGDKSTKGKVDSKAVFSIFTNGLKTNRDTWVYNSSRRQLEHQVSASIVYFNEKVEALIAEPTQDLESLIEWDSTKFAWGTTQKKYLSDKSKLHYFDASVGVATYRPYNKQFVYYNKFLNERQYQLPKIYPTSKHKNLIIQMTGNAGNRDFSCLMSSVIPDVQLMFNGQGFPLYYYEKRDPNANTLGLDLDEKEGDYIRHSAITDWALGQFRHAYGDFNISKEDIFYYIYGVLHSPQFRETYANDLRKEMARIPYVRDFQAYSTAGRELAQWHLNYEEVEPYPLTEEWKGATQNFTVEKMKYPSKTNKSAIIYNKHLTLTGIPTEAHNYIVNGKSALDWLIDRYRITTHKDSQITNNPNLWCEEHNTPRYIIDLIKRITRVSLETVRIVKALPPFDVL
ncbi:MAG: type ISP restriction/modification enzyme [Rikenellaceae bacterium]